MKEKTFRMKKIILLLLTLVLFSCNTEKDKNERLKLENAVLKGQVESKRASLSILDTQLEKREYMMDDLMSQMEEIGYVLEFDKQPRYIVKLRLKQSHISLDPFEHMKDGMNAIEFEIPVDREYYTKLEIGDEIVNDFRTGSLLLYGSFGNWDMRVIDKRME